MKTPLQFIRKYTALFSLVIATTHASAQVATLIQDVNTGSANSSPSQLTYCSTYNCFFFVADNGSTGAELWKYDISSGVASLVKDIYPGATTSSITALVWYPTANVVVFGANDGVNGNELWKSDGTAAGTTMIMDINPGAASSSPNNFAIFASKLIFSADNGTNGKEPWISNATAGGTALLKDINPGTPVSDPNLFTVSNGKVFFRANDGTVGSELWLTDMTSGGTVLVKDVFPGAQASVPLNLVDVNNTLFFSANDGTDGAELWKSDGTTAGTVLVKDINPGASGSINSGPGAKAFFTNFGNNLYFQASDGSAGYELWKSDGTTAGTMLVKDIYSGATSSNPSGIYATSTVMYLAASDATNGYEVWTSDGTTAGTTLLKDIYAGTSSGASIATTFLSDASGTIYFAANDGTAGVELWRTNGAAASTSLAADINPGSASSNPGNMITSANILYFSATNVTTGTEPYKFGAIGAGVNEVTGSTNGLQIYPNPFSSKLNVNMGSNDVYDLSVFNAIGELVLSKEKLSGSQEIDLSRQARGLYVVIVNSPGSTIVKKVVKD